MSEQEPARFYFARGPTNYAAGYNWRVLIRVTRIVLCFRRIITTSEWRTACSQHKGRSSGGNSQDAIDTSQVRNGGGKWHQEEGSISSTDLQVQWCAQQHISVMPCPARPLLQISALFNWWTPVNLRALNLCNMFAFFFFAKEQPLHPFLACIFF